MAKQFDVIVVGAGLAGSAAAIEASRGGLNVCLLERATIPGEKNVSGGVLYSKVLDDFIPEWQKEAPIERWIVKNSIGMSTPKSLALTQFESEDLENNACTVNRTNFDRWLAQKAEEAGATLITSTVVEDLIIEHGVIKGVKTNRPDGDLEADIVICADGVNSLLAQKAGLRKNELAPREIGVGIKEVLSLPPEVINERFGLEGNQGIAYTFIGSFLHGAHGGAFLYTNKDTLSLGLVVNLGSVKNETNYPLSIFEEFKRQPQVKKLIEGGTLVEYCAHLVPEIGQEMVPSLYGNGIMVVGDAAGFVLNNGFTIQGMNYAIASGMLAGNTAVEAIKTGDASSKTLVKYQNKINESFIGKNLETYKKTYQILANPRFSSEYPQVVEEVAKKIFSFEGAPNSKLFKTVKNAVGDKVSFWQLVKDGIDIWRYM